MSVLVCTLQGRFGNQCLQYLFCRALAERYDMELRIDPWIGERVFQIEHARPTAADNEARRFNEIEIFDAAEKSRREDPEGFYRIAFRGYAQMQQAMIYSKRQAQEWLKFSPEIWATCGGLQDRRMPIIAHRRVGDYVGYGYPVVSEQSYFDACYEFGLNDQRMSFVTEETATKVAALPDDLQFVGDFYRMVRAKALLRANSSFSWLAGLLGNGLVLSPIVNGLEGGKEHECEFVAGNWPKFAPHLDFVTDLHVP